MPFPPVPPEIKSIAHILKVADEHDNRNIVVSYWARMHACQTAVALIPKEKSPAVSKLLIALMDWLEETKKANHEVEGITNQTVAHAMIEQYAMQLFAYADGQDRAESFHKNMIKAFYTAGILMDILEQFGELSEDFVAKRKYAKWKAAYIHNCLKTGDTPTAGGPDEHLNNVIDTSNTDNDDTNNLNIAGGSNSVHPTGDQDFLSGPAPASSPVTPATPVAPPAQPSPFIPQPAFIPTPAPVPIRPSPSGGVTVNPEHIQKAQKFCKYATSALNYDDVKTAIDNLTKALNMLQTGQEN